VKIFVDGEVFILETVVAEIGDARPNAVVEACLIERFERGLVE